MARLKAVELQRSFGYRLKATVAISTLQLRLHNKNRLCQAHWCTCFTGSYISACGWWASLLLSPTSWWMATQSTQMSQLNAANHCSYIHISYIISKTKRYHICKLISTQHCFLKNATTSHSMPIILLLLSQKKLESSRKLFYSAFFCLSGKNYRLELHENFTRDVIMDYGQGSLIKYWRSSTPGSRSRNF